jgi:hypothetical protein
LIISLSSTLTTTTSKFIQTWIRNFHIECSRRNLLQMILRGRKDSPKKTTENSEIRLSTYKKQSIRKWHNLHYIILPSHIYYLRAEKHTKIFLFIIQVTDRSRHKKFHFIFAFWCICSLTTTFSLFLSLNEWGLNVEENTQSVSIYFFQIKDFKSRLNLCLFKTFLYFLKSYTLQM